MKRKWSGAPAWVDYTVQAMNWLENGLNSIIRKLRLDYRWELLDKHCQCKKCIDRRRL